MHGVLTRHRRLGVVLILTALASALSSLYFFSIGSLLYFGDAEAHLNTARRLLDSTTPGWDQLGRTWLPLPHLLLAPFAASMRLWQTGLAGSISGGICFVAACGFFYAAMRRIFGEAPAAVGVAVLVLNPNMLYLQSIPMTEPVFLAALLGLLYFSVRGSIVGAGIMALAATMTRYEGWFLLPFVAFYFLRTRGLLPAIGFGAMAAVGPLFWFGYNWWEFGNVLDFYNGPYSAIAIQGAPWYPGRGQWSAALQYYFTTVRLVAARPLLWIGALGLVVALSRRAYWPVLLLALPPCFYLWSIHSASTPIHVPVLWPFSYYNARYGLAAMPLLALGMAALASIAPRNTVFAALLVFVACGGWLWRPSPEKWITWKESQVNSVARRDWTEQAGEFFRGRRLSPEDRIFTGFSDITGIYRVAGIPLARTLTPNNGIAWTMATARPDLFLWERWAVAQTGEDVDRAVTRAGSRFELVRKVKVQGAPDLNIYYRQDVPK